MSRWCSMAAGSTRCMVSSVVTTGASGSGRDRPARRRRLASGDRVLVGALPKLAVVTAIDELISAIPIVISTVGSALGDEIRQRAREVASQPGSQAIAGHRRILDPVLDRFSDLAYGCCEARGISPPQDNDAAHAWAGLDLVRRPGSRRRSCRADRNHPVSCPSIAAARLRKAGEA